MADPGAAAAAAADTTEQPLNVNVGLLGHVDSGKTSLAKALSTVASTASFDKNPQSKERGITLDLGFSSFTVDAPERFQELGSPSKLQITLVDCPGHASLIKTVLGGAKIIDLMILVIDITKGIQTQTAECLVIGELTCDVLVVVLNKVDLFPEKTRAQSVEKVTTKLRKVFAQTKFKDPPMVPVAANAGSGEHIGIPALIEELKQRLPLPQRTSEGPFAFAVDHCFAVRGQGTVMTGTVLSGAVSVGDNIELPALKAVRKVKSMQMFRQPVQRASQGDRLGICVTQFDPKQLERGLACTPDSLPLITAAIIRAERVRFFKGSCTSKDRFHASVGHETVMCTATFFANEPTEPSCEFSLDREFRQQEELVMPPTGAAAAVGGGKDGKGGQGGPADGAAAAASGGGGGGAGAEAGEGGAEAVLPGPRWALLEFASPVVCEPGSMVICSKLDADINANSCRLAFSGEMVMHTVDKEYAQTLLPQLRIYRSKERTGTVDRLQDTRTVVGKGMFTKDTNMDKFAGLTVRLSTGEVGKIDGGFGQSGKFRVYVKDGLADSTVARLKAKGGGDGPVQITMTFKKYLFDSDKKTLKQ